MRRGGRILWVDDNPTWHAPLTQLFRQLGMTVEGARSTAEAMSRLSERSYDLIITDMRRDTEEPADTAGVTLLNALQRRMVGPLVLVVSGGFDPPLGVHPRVFAYVRGADEVVHRVIDIMERVRFGASV